MPMLQPYVGDLEQYNPNPSSGFDMKALTDTWMQARAIKENRMKQDRDKQILEAVISGQPIPTATPQAQPQGMMGRLGEFMTGGRPNVGPSSLETAMVEAKMKNMFLSPTDELIKKGQAATAEKAIYDAGGPRPSLFGNVPTAPASDQQLSLILQNAPQGIQEQITAEQPSSPVMPQVGQYYSPELDEFGRPKGFKMKEPSAAQEKRTVESKELGGLAKNMIGLYGEARKEIQKESGIPGYGRPGVTGRFAGVAASVKAKAGYLPKTNVFIDRVKAFATITAKAAGEQRPTDQDIVRFMGTMMTIGKNDQENAIQMSQQLKDLQEKGINVNWAIPLLSEYEQITGVKVPFTETGNIIQQPQQLQVPVVNQGKQDIRAVYNALRSQGVSAEEAKKRLGL